MLCAPPHYLIKYHFPFSWWIWDRQGGYGDIHGKIDIFSFNFNFQFQFQINSDINGYYPILTFSISKKWITMIMCYHFNMSSQTSYLNNKSNEFITNWHRWKTDGQEVLTKLTITNKLSQHNVLLLIKWLYVLRISRLSLKCGCSACADNSGGQSWWTISRDNFQGQF